MAVKFIKKLVLRLSWGIFILAVVLLGASCIRIGIGKGSGDGKKIEKADKIRIVVIEVSEKEITIDKKPCKNAEALVKEINAICAKEGTEKVRFELKNNYAIKSVYGKVKKSLAVCEKTLGIHYTAED